MKRHPADKIEPYSPKYCKYHPRRFAVVWAKFGTSPGVSLCEECHLTAVRDYEGKMQREVTP